MVIRNFKCKNTSVFRMESLANGVTMTSKDWEEKIGWIFVNLIKNGKVVRKINYDGNPLRIDTRSGKEFDKIVIECFSGKVMRNSGFTLESTLKKVQDFSKFDCIQVNEHLYNDGVGNDDVIRECFDLSNEAGEDNEETTVYLSEYTKFVIIKLSSLDSLSSSSTSYSDISSSDEESDECEGEGVVKRKRPRYDGEEEV